MFISNLILKYSDKVTSNDIETENLQKLYSMSIKSNLASVRFFGIQNLKNDSKNLLTFVNQLSELKNTEKNENVLELL